MSRTLSVHVWSCSKCHAKSMEHYKDAAASKRDAASHAAECGGPTYSKVVWCFGGPKENARPCGCRDCAAGRDTSEEARLARLEAYLAKVS